MTHGTAPLVRGSSYDHAYLMSGTKAIWIVAALLLSAAVALALLPGGAGPMAPDAPRGSVRADPTEPPRALESLSTSAPSASAISNVTGPSAQQVSEAAAGTMPTGAASSPAPTAKAPREPVERAPDAVDLGMDQAIRMATVTVGNIVPRKDPATGEEYLLADGKYEIRGRGTFEEPYRASWECLASASKTYLPRLREYEIPQRIALLNGKWLRIEGFLAFPLMVRETKDLTVTLNQWDGCCIGIPPTCYDGIEVKLLEPAKRSGAHALFNYGTVQGKLRVDPYIVGNFLSGLYVLDDAMLVKNAQPEL